MKRAWKILQDGILILTPFVLTIYVGLFILEFINKVGKDLLGLTRWGDMRGAGLLVMLGLIVVVGLLWQSQKVRHALGILEQKMMSIRSLNSFYRIVKELTRTAIGRKQPFSRVVLVNRPNGEKQLGLLTTEDLTALELPESLVTVFLPLGMQLGGHLVLIPKELLEPVDMTVEAALRFCFTGGVSIKE
ncbi:DUF502 domain-containing protein [Tumebacillus permanentifrigoris]|uniref:Putative membrane protein n=1 Tax=Tumebacillus permanentifrigoris TaxID=378543 RepID=A0A316D4G7_9BACL|nr:DUF502 domain-containing protein [Tumebacillus permanentifrigoris]PWK06990.1 putative membrane protein [Tumebacillus permanentifrigoris]